MPSVQEIVSRTYSPEEVANYYLSGELKDIALHGYVARADTDFLGNRVMRFVHVSEATDFDNPRSYAIPDAKEKLREGLPERKKRTPQQQVASLLVRMLSQVKSTGGLGLTDEQVRSITGEAWKQGITGWTAEDVRKVAQSLMESADKASVERDRHRTARYGGEGN